MFENDLDKQNEYYSKRASEYEQIYYRDNKERRQEIEDDVERLKVLAKGKSVLELACGTGYWTTQVSETALSVIATDFSDEMIVEAKKKEYHCPIQFMQADLHHLPFAEPSCDLLLLGFWFSHEPCQDYEKLFKTLLGQIKTHGKIWMIDNNPPAEGDKFQAVGKDAHGNNYKRRFLDDDTEYKILKNYFSKESLREIFEPYFEIESLIHNKYYWSTVLSAKR